jgi:hypothetical protein
MYLKPQTHVIDDFFENPHYVRELGLKTATQIFALPRSPHLRFRGKRSCHLSKIDEKIYKKIIIYLCKACLGINFDENKYKSVESKCGFQLTDGTWTEGWVHHDGCIITSIIYLNENPPINTGTAVYIPKHPAVGPLHVVFQKESNSDPALRVSEEHDRKRKENNDQFIETVTVQNVFNRHVSFLGNQWHRGVNHFGDTDETSRLTIVTQIFDFGDSFRNPI